MAMAVITSLLLKIVDVIRASEESHSTISLLLTRISAMKELLKDISDIKNELKIMQSYLQIAERLKEKDQSIKIFIEQTRDLAFDIEDIIDEFTYKLGEAQGGVRPTSINIKTWDGLSSKLKENKIKLQNIMERSKQYDTKGMENEARRLIAVGSSKSRAESAHFVKEDDIVGIDNNRELLLEWLEDDDEQQRQHATISVLGMGGLGKTTLVTHVYKTIKDNFGACAWVTVSQSYNTDDLLRQILKEFYREDREQRQAPNDIDTMDCRSLVETIRTYLQYKNYVLILDDVWTTDVLDDDINFALLDSNSKSRIVLTTRIHEVALLADEHRMFELKPLEADHSWDLFCKKAFWKSANKICPQPLEQCAKKFVEKCGGLPLAIVSIARLLSFRKQTGSEWEKVYKDLEWHLTNNESKLREKVHHILKLSLDDLPHYLQNCFLYCSCFPEDYKICSDRLIRLWVAEGFIEERRGKTMEEVAEDYLNELVHRCLLQVVERDEIVGRVQACRMHDVIRVLAISESADQLRFCEVYEHSRTILQGNKARRLSILSSITNNCIENKSHLRSVFAFNKSISSDLLECVLRSSKFLRVLELQGAPIEELPSEICNLFNLHYLVLRVTKIKELPISIGKLRNLQVLDLQDSELVKIPEEISELQKLRHLNLWAPKSELPVGIRRLKGLQTFIHITATAEIVRNVEALTELRAFGISHVRTHHCADLWNSITKMNHLSKLYVQSEYGQELQQLGTLHLPLSLKTLFLNGKLDKTSFPELAASFGPLTNLTTLIFHYASLDEDTFPHLQKLPVLISLRLSHDAYDGMKLHFQATSFPKLKELYISHAPKLSQVDIERGAMASLNKLQLCCCLEVKELPHGIEYLTTLQYLDISYPAEELVELLLGGGGGEGDHSNDWRTRVRHIPNFTIGFMRDGQIFKERIQ